MKRYSEEFKEQIVRRLMPPNAQSVAEVSRTTGISAPSLYHWRNQYRQKGHVVPADPKNPERWSGADKLAVIIETAALNEADLAEYCRRKGLYPEQIAQWREAAAAGTDAERPLTREERQAWQAEKKRSRKLERELTRKEKALAEAAALLVLAKKAQAAWGDREDD